MSHQPPRKIEIFIRDEDLPPGIGAALYVTGDWLVFSVNSDKHGCIGRLSLKLIGGDGEARVEMPKDGSGE